MKTHALSRCIILDMQSLILFTIDWRASNFAGTEQIIRINAPYGACRIVSRDH